MKILSPEEIQELSYSSCRQQLALIGSSYDLERNILEYQAEIWPELDALTTMICELKDRIRDFEDPRIASMQPDTTVEPRRPDAPPPRPRRRRYRIDDVIYASVNEASEKTGMRLSTLRTYVSRNPERYSFLDHDE